MAASLVMILELTLLMTLASVYNAQVFHMDHGHKNSWIQAAPKCGIKEDNARFDCFPGLGASQQACEARGCCWKLPNHQVARNTTNPGRYIDIPYCYFPENIPGYVVTTITPTDYGYTAVIERSSPSSWPDDVMKLQMEILFETETRLHFKLFDPSNKRFEVPIETPKVTKKVDTTDYDVNIQKAPFGIKVTRKSTGAVMFDSTIQGAPLIFADQFLQISTHTGTGKIYGLGEHMTPFLMSNNWQQVTMWNRDINPQFGANLYGAHPFYLGKEADGQFHGVFLLNSNAMDVDLQPLPALTFRTIGGVLDFYVFAGPSGEDVVQQYTEVVGRPYLPPYWSLGFHLCRWGYGGVDGMQKIIKRNRDLGIPYDVQWNDIDYMAAYRDWTYDQKKFAALPSVVDDLHKNGQKYVIIVDPAISNTLPGEYPPYDEGIKDGIFIINNQTKQPLVGMVWPGTTVFPDFSNPNAEQWWYNQASEFHTKIPFDGLWIDMNDPSSEMFGSTVGCGSGKYDNPPYVPGLVGADKLPSRTICPSSLQYLSTHYDLHNLYGLQEAKATDRVLQKLLNKRSLVISRSTFPSQGQYGGHWTGDIHSTWQDMQYTIPAILKFNMFGIPLVGSDICGFADNTTEELCVRWTQLGAFYPFMRNHNSLGNADQDPGAFSSQASDIMRQVLEIRYTLLPHLYTLFYQSHITGATVARSLVFQYPGDAQTENIDRQFMWGDGLLISPVLEQGVRSVHAYLPTGRWYDIYTGQPVTGGRWADLAAPLDKINVHTRGGVILPLQEPNVTTTLSRRQPFSLWVAPDNDGTAQGDLFWDDGESLGSVEKGLYNMIHFTSSKGKLSSSVVKSGFDTKMELGLISILGMSSAPQNVTVNGQATKFRFAEGQLFIGPLNLDLKTAFTAQWV